jgi:FdhE protein
MHYNYPPSMDRLNREIENHVKKNKGLAQIFNVYREVLNVQLEYLDKIKVSVNLSADELKNYFMGGKHLLSEQKINIDTELFREILFSLSKAISKAIHSAPEFLQQLGDAEEFNENNMGNFLKKIVSFNKEELEKFIEEEGIDNKTGVDSEIIAFIIFMSLSPFYSLYMNEVRKKIDFSIWRRGYCPVCGQTAVIAKHRSEDGARVLNCWLCHAEWVYPRLECPYCENKDQKKLRFFYVPGDMSRQVHVCEKCKKYLKTIDTKIMQKEVILDVEAIATGYLDIVAEREGYKPPDAAAILN